MTTRNMADTSSDWQTQQNAVIDLNDMDPGGSDNSDYETNISDARKGQGAEGNYVDSMKQRLQENVTSMMWQSGKQKATKAWNVYGNIDFLRPYFNVEPHEVRTRLMWSMVPQKPRGERLRVPRELYGPMMVIFTLIALLLLQMKSAEHKVEEGTLMGTAFGVCFTYWFGASGFILFLSYVCNTHLTLIQILSMMGYGLTGHCLVILLGTVIHTSHDHMFFYLLWATVGGLSTLRMISIVVSRTQGQSQRMIVCGALAALHLLFLLYLHFAYHQIVEDLSGVFASHHEPIAAAVADAPPDVKLPEVQDNSIVQPDTKDIIEQTKRALRPAVDVVKSLNNTVVGAAKIVANQSRPLMSALKDGVRLTNDKAP